MAANPEKKAATPPLVSFTSFRTFLNELREHEHVPARIDKSLMARASGSQIAAMLASLKYLGLIDELGKPQERFRDLVAADDEARKPLIGEILRASYGFVLNDPDFDIEKATSGQLAEKFRELGIYGSTVTKTIAFFLSAAKDAGMKVSPHLKPPPAPKANGGSRKNVRRPKDDELSSQDVDSGELLPDEEVERFEIPIPGKSSVKVIVPSDLDADDWEMLQSMISVYIKRWKGFKDKGST